MPRNVNGLYTLPPGINPVVTGQPIAATWANPTMEDIRDALTDSLSRSGDGGMNAPLLFANGSVGAPSVAFTNDPSTGLYFAGAGDMRVVVAGNENLRLQSSGQPQWWNGLAWEDMAVEADIDILAPIDAPVFTGIPEADTAAPDTNTAQLATTGFVFAEAATKAEILGDTANVFNVAVPSTNNHAIRRTTWAGETTGGTMKVRIDTNDVYVTTNGDTP